MSEREPNYKPRYPATKPPRNRNEIQSRGNGTAERVDKSRHYNPPPPPKNFGNAETAKVVRRMNARVSGEAQQEDVIFGGWFKGAIVWTATWTTRVFSSVILFCTLVALNLLDVIVGGVTMGLTYRQGVDFMGFQVSPFTIAMLFSVVMSGIQVFLRMSWRTEGYEVEGQRAILVYGLAAVDTGFDMLLPFWTDFGETPYHVKFSSKPALFYVKCLVIGALCAYSEQFTIELADLGQKM